MRITDVQIHPIRKGDDKLKAFATMTIDQCFVVRDLKVIYGNKGLFVAMPSRRKGDGAFSDIAHPLDSETRMMIEDAIIGEYLRVMNIKSDRPMDRRRLDEAEVSRNEPATGSVSR